MFLHTVEIQDRKYEELYEESETSLDFIEKNIKEDEMAMFYGDQKLFIDSFVNYYIEEVQKSLFFISTDQSGYDTYDSAVYCAYTEKEAIKMSENNMSYLDYRYSNTADLIGIASSDVDVGEVISSFNAG